MSTLEDYQITNDFDNISNTLHVILQEHTELDLFSNSYVLVYRIAHALRKFQNTIKKKNEELTQALNLYTQCLMLIETTLKNRKY